MWFWLKLKFKLNELSRIRVCVCVWTEKFVELQVEGVGKANQNLHYE